METLVNTFLGLGMLTIIGIVIKAISEPGNKAKNFKSGMKDAYAGLSDSFAKTADSVNHKLNNWTDPKIDKDRAYKRLRRTNTKCNIKVEGSTTFITAYDKDFAKYIAVEYRDGKFVRYDLLDDAEVSDMSFF
ncbi:MAG: hypothetical protein NDI81_04325 [Desulfobacula sp.]|nr:hypothetical protein [Desulfobacula sp.]